METAPAATTQVLTTGTFYQWVDTPLAVALLFGCAGGVFIGILLLRRRRNK